MFGFIARELHLRYLWWLPRLGVNRPQLDGATELLRGQPRLGLGGRNAGAETVATLLCRCALFCEKDDDDDDDDDEPRQARDKF